MGIKVEKIEVTAPSRQLTATWIIEKGTSEIFYSDDMAKEIVEEIDWEILLNLLVADGWIKVCVSNNTPHDLQAEMQDWVKENCTGSYKNYRNAWVFVEKEDAAWFKLRWA